MADSFQTRCLHTIIRHQHASRDDMCLYSNQVIRLLVEEGLVLLPFGRKNITTSGVGLLSRGVCGPHGGYQRITCGRGYGNKFPSFFYYCSDLKDDD